MKVKCIGCPELVREVSEVGGLKVYKTDEYGRLVTYICDRFPYATVIGGLLRPGKGILEAVRLCPIDITDRCVVCSKEGKLTYGHPYSPFAYSCKEHYDAWDKWLKDHPERREHLHGPTGRVILANWVEVFREFVQEELEGQP